MLFKLSGKFGTEPCVPGVGVEALAAPDLQVEMELVVRLPD
jgi:hypothetical protein